MKILHTADWHLGHRLHEQHQLEEQQLFLNWLYDYIVNEAIDVLLVSGDVFDTNVPSTQSQALYYDFLIKLHGSCCKHIVITGGNHDAPGTLNAPKGILQALNIQVVGKATEHIEDEVFEIKVGAEQVYIAAVPYLRDQDIRRAVSGEQFDEIGDRYQTALIKHYAAAAKHIDQINTTDAPSIAMGHLFAIGGTTSDSEQTIYVGSLGDIGADDFPETFDYIALGHLHRPQIVGKKNHIRYSGSPCCYSFSEVGYAKKVIQVVVKDKGIQDIETVGVPNFRTIDIIKGSFDEVIEQLNNLSPSTTALTPWYEVRLKQHKADFIELEQINQIADNKEIKILKVTHQQDRQQEGLDTLHADLEHVKNITPSEVFELKCQEQDIDLSADAELLDAFNEALQIAQNQ